jgi:alpha-glucoside transport system ATP-binding protein
MANVSIRKVVKAYEGDVQAVKGIDLEIEDHEFVVLVGPSGCGKSTTLRMIAGLEEITAGEVWIGGDVVNDVPPRDRDIAMVFQNYALYPHMSVFENMAFGLKLRKFPKDEIKRRVDDAAKMLDIQMLLDRKPKALSGGQRQRVAMGRAIVRNPKVFLFDEPLSNLDAALRVATRIEIAKLKESMPNTTMIYVTHDQVEAMTLADRIVVLKDGRIEQVGSPMELYRHPGNLFVAQFIGSPAMNILPGTIDKAGPITSIMVAGRRISVPVATPADAAGANVSFGVRPEDLTVTTANDFIIEGVADYLEQLGEVQLIYLDVGRAGEPLVAKMPGNAEIKRGEKIRLAAAPGDLHIFDAAGTSYARARLEVKAA